MISKKVLIFAIAVLLLSCFLLFKRVTDPRPSSYQSDWDVPWTLKCEACGEQFEQSKYDFAARTRDREDFTPAMTNLGHCKACDTEWSARIMQPNESGELKPIADEPEPNGRPQR